MARPTKPYGMSDAEAKDWVRKMPSSNQGNPQNGTLGTGKQVPILDIPSDKPAPLPKGPRKLQTNCDHGTVPGITGWDGSDENAEPKRTVSYSAAQDNTGIIELENRCTGNRTVGSNPTPSPIWLVEAGLPAFSEF